MPRTGGRAVGLEKCPRPYGGCREPKGDKRSRQTTFSAWKAVCAERCLHGLGRGGWKRAVFVKPPGVISGRSEEHMAPRRPPTSSEGERMLARDALTNNSQRLLETGEPVAVKAARRVREGAIGAGPTLAGTSPVAYFIKICEIISSSSWIGSEPACRLSRIPP
jgi:hypothetical protein